MNKTNNNWYPYERVCNYYRLIDGALVSRPMNVDGSRATGEVEVDFDMLASKKGDHEKDGKIITLAGFLRN